ncbi:hypothetical protein HBH98_130530 [Parastagonospora nodorum]|nr:hypothetical protein HBH98_130530 [Parastagonospora nodorum]KAH4373098.1 hypothetical protein HBH97_128950 [Parastagonospora nodorum]KAH4399103.1 hypothetical protein HBH99_104160 [Parastagonospora nodorum]KAH4900145.1 hypothetical protein HBI80_160030 [Parastagonospora nodorum]
MPGSLQAPSTSGTSSLDGRSRKTSDLRQSRSPTPRVPSVTADSLGSLSAVVTCAQKDITGLATPRTAPVSSNDSTIASANVVNVVRLHAPVPTHYMPVESFPVFHTGNVIIQCSLVDPPKKWQLHGAILERHSSWFRYAMHVAPQNREHFYTWSFFLLDEHDGQVALVLQEAKSVTHSEGEGQSILSSETTQDSSLTIIPTPPMSATLSASFGRDLDQTVTNEAHAATVDMYDQILGSFYSIPLRIPSDTISATLSACESLVKLSHSLSSTALISAQISTALHQHRRSLYTAISADPARFLLLAMLLCNDAIFSEALIHIAGAHPCWPWPAKRTCLPEEIIQLVVRKSAELGQMCLEAERDLLLLTIHIDRFGPVEPQVHSTFPTWFIVATFRDQFARTFHALEADRQASLKRGALFRKIRKGGEEYMALGEMRRLMARVMPSAVGGLEEDLGMLKECARGVVEDLARNELCLDVEGGRVGYLTCVKVGREDVPWRAGGKGLD